MKRRYLAYAGVIAVLLAVNLGRWWLHTGSGPSAAHGPALLPQDFRLRVNVPVAGEVRRNLFAPQSLASGAVVPAARPGRVAQRAVPSATAGTAPAEVPAAQAGLGRLRLLGVVFRGGKGQAYLALDKNNVIAHSGDTVFGQFTVDRVMVDVVELRDLTNNNTRRIPVSGK